MKQLLLLFLFVPFGLSARNDPRVPPKTAPYDGVKTVQATYIFVIKKGNDTGIVETHRYNEEGWLTNYTYDQHLMKNPPYFMSTTYQYSSDNSWTTTTYKNRKISDSAVVNGAWANHYWYYNGKLNQVNEFRGDTFAERKVVNGSFVFVHGDTGKVPMNRDDFWDYGHAGKFANRILSKSVDTDTIKYLDEQGRTLIMIVNFYDNNFRNVKTDYYNYRVKRFDLFYMPYSDRMDMIFFLNKSKKGHWSYEITRKYNEKGWLIEEYFTDARPYKGANGTPMVKKYTYELFE